MATVSSLSIDLASFQKCYNLLIKLDFNKNNFSVVQKIYQAEEPSLHELFQSKVQITSLGNKQFDFSEIAEKMEKIEKLQKQFFTSKESNFQSEILENQRLLTAKIQELRNDAENLLTSKEGLEAIALQKEINHFPEETISFLTNLLGEKPNLEVIRLLQYASKEELEKVEKEYTKTESHGKYLKLVHDGNWNVLLKEAKVSSNIGMPDRVHLILIAIYLRTQKESKPENRISIADLSNAFLVLSAAQASQYTLYSLSSFKEVRNQLIQNGVVLTQSDTEKLEQMCKAAERIPKNQRFFITISQDNLTSLQKNLITSYFHESLNTLLFHDKVTLEAKKKNPTTMPAFIGTPSFSLTEELFKEKFPGQSRSFTSVLGLSERKDMIFRLQQGFHDFALLLPSVAAKTFIHGILGTYFFPYLHDGYHRGTREKGYTFMPGVLSVAQIMEEKVLAKMDPYVKKPSLSFDAVPLLESGSSEHDLERWLIELTCGGIVDGILPNIIASDTGAKITFPLSKEVEATFWGQQAFTYMSMLCYHQNSPINSNYSTSKQIEKAVFTPETFQSSITKLLEKFVFLLV